MIQLLTDKAVDAANREEGAPEDTFYLGDFVPLQTAYNDNERIIEREKLILNTDYIIV